MTPASLLFWIAFTNTLMILGLIGIAKRIDKMAISQAQFDTDLADFLKAFGDLITAIESGIGSQAPADLSAEDQQIKDAAVTAAAELAKLSPPPPPAA